MAAAYSQTATVTHRSEFLARFDFSPDPFQLEAFDAIDAGQNVLVAAPTSSGKTMVAEYAIAAAAVAGVRVFYTTPIKALSNQKFADLSAWLGPERVGLLTGDNVIRGDADVVVMTTEVLRNMIYSGSRALDDLGYVVLDEVHFLQDSYRGPVWEEVIIQVPPPVKLIGLSATVSNALELAEWIDEVRGTCRCVIEPTRPVELQPRIVVADRVKNVLEDMALLKGGLPNDETAKFIQSRSDGPRRRGRRRLARPRRVETIDHLYDAGRLPAIFFIFSRKGCEEAVQQVVHEGIEFLDTNERSRVEKIFEEHTEDLSAEDLRALDAEHFLAGLLCGVGAHHAGLIPPFKEAVEACFIAGLLQVVFATETLALGVNMPAKSVAIEQLSRFKGEGHVLLTPGDFAQLTGRAGRRGIDDLGFAYVLWSPYVEFDDAAALAASKSFELRSVFRPTYNMAANLVATRTEQGAVELLQQSFAQFQSNRAIVGLTRRVGLVKSELTERKSRYLEAHGTTDPPTGAAQTRHRRADQHIAGQHIADQHSTDQDRAGQDDAGQHSADQDSVGAHSAARSYSKDIDAALARLRPGDVIREDPRRDRTSLLVIGVSQRRNTGTRVRVVTPRGKSMTLSAADFGSEPDVLERVDLPEPYEPARREFQKRAAALLRRSSAGSQARPAEDADLAAPGNLERSATDRASEYRKIERLRAELGRLEHRLDGAGHGLGRALRSIVEVLRDLGYVEGWSLTPKGTLLRSIFNEHDLWVAESLHNGVLDDLDPARLAAVVSALTFQRRGPGPAPTPWYPDDLVRDRVGELRAVARRLSTAERAAGLSETPDPEPDFVPIAHAWTLGIGLDELLSDEDMAGGDFVRNVRQLIDMLRQISEVAPLEATRSSAREAIGGLDRGLVAASTRVEKL